MHDAAFAFVREAVEGITMHGKRVLEIGSYSVNGSIRPLFAGAKAYKGIDQTGGPDVDQVVTAADYDGKGAYDIVVSCEAMEHSADPADIVTCAWQALKPGGLFVLTAAGTDRPAHNCDGSPHRGVEPYQNITRAALKRMLADWHDATITEAHGPHDIYATASKPEDTADSTPAKKPATKPATKED